MIAVELEEKKKRIRFTTKGDVKSSNIKDFNSEFNTLMSGFKSAKWKDLYLDLRNARIVDSVALNWIFQMVREVQDGERKVVLQIASPAIHRVVCFSGLDRLAQVKYRPRKQVR